jgi:hypothetical protein
MENESKEKEMAEARASWNLRYVSREGFDMMLTLRDDDEAALSERVAKVLAGVIKAGGRPKHGESTCVPNGNGEERKEENGAEADEEDDGKTYLDEKGVRHCNRQTSDGHRCGALVTRREGKYGPFWSCPRYKEHAK